MKLSYKPKFSIPSVSPAHFRRMTVLVWCLAVALAVWVALQLTVPAPQLAPAMPAESSVKYQMDQSAEARLMGVETAGGLTPPSVKLLGLFAGESGQGAAVLSIEGQAAQSISVGQTVANGWTLDEVGPSFAVLGRSGQRHQVDLPLMQADPNMLVRVPAN